MYYNSNMDYMLVLLKTFTLLLLVILFAYIIMFKFDNFVDWLIKKHTDKSINKFNLDKNIVRVIVLIISLLVIVLIFYTTN